MSLESLAGAMSQLARIGQELMRPEQVLYRTELCMYYCAVQERDPVWRTVPCAKEILVQKGIANRAPWEMIQVKQCF